jgi:holo-[acyl-carrier protein] synthase
MLIDIGTDIIAIERIEKSLNRFGDTFLHRFLNKEEIPFVHTAQNAAGFWAAKEAVAKALGCGIGKELSFHDIVITKDVKGAPSIRFNEETRQHHHIERCSLSISHDGGFAIAVAVILHTPPKGE